MIDLHIHCIALAELKRKKAPQRLFELTLILQSKFIPFHPLQEYLQSLVPLDLQTNHLTLI